MVFVKGLEQKIILRFYIFYQSLDMGLIPFATPSSPLSRSCWIWAKARCSLKILS
ncbi:Hypothetical protein BN2458_PEG1374 [Helicobacter typhlonius]|uniref:Uncharacterized protein n=1 Tax=Helicobacter typhlonius TaxID=76936 RepID=A0A0S4PVE1_9HELI|nr:Hypothetical protein BN2458_PEG1374 [Helicobacter typhlonius]